jgi:serine/threonine-protein kinase
VRGTIEQTDIEAVILVMRALLECASPATGRANADKGPDRMVDHIRIGGRIAVAAGCDAASVALVNRARRVSPAPSEDEIPPRWKPGDTLDGSYVLLEWIGQGGMGNVFIAEQLSLGRSVAIKLLRPELVAVPDLVRRIQDEATLAGRVRDPHCVMVFDRGVLRDGTPYIVMEHVRGRPLRQVIAEGAISLPRAVALFDQVLSALDAIHRLGIVHGDVKSDNFLIEPRGGTDHVTLIDFGLAHVVGSPPWPDHRDGEIVISGTPEYMAPEIIGGATPSPASDLYGASVILYELLTGTMPFGGRTDTEIFRRHAREKVSRPLRRGPDREVPPALDRVVLRALDKLPEARFPDAASLASAVRKAARMRCRSARPVQPSGCGAAIRDAGLSPQHGTVADCDRDRSLRCGHIEALQRAIGNAIRRGDVAAIADGYLELAGLLVRVRRPSCAVCELQEGIDVLTAGCDPSIGRGPLLDRLFIAMAALYEKDGERKLARHAATRTDDRPTSRYQVG